MVSVIIALNAGARCLRSLLNYRLRSANNVPLSTLPLFPSPFVSPPHNPVLRRSSSIERKSRSSRLLSFSLFRPISPIPALLSRRHDAHTTAYLLLASPLNGISVLSDGPRAELRPCTSLARFLLLSVVATCSHSLSVLFLFRFFAEYIARTERADASLSFSSTR